MARRTKPTTAPRNRPRQARSQQLVADILTAAIRVLEREGAQRFTTIRVAEQAGVSVGSLYQYFPNKQAILFRLQLDEWEATSGMIDRLLGDASRPPAQRLRDTIRAFFHSECDEAPLRRALDAAVPSYHDTPETAEHRRRGDRILADFVAAAAPRASRRRRAIAADLIIATTTALGKHVSERGVTRAEVDGWARAAGDMLLAYLAHVDSMDAPPRRRAPARRHRRS